MPRPPSAEVEMLDTEFLAFDDAEDADAEIAVLIRDREAPVYE